MDQPSNKPTGALANELQNIYDLRFEHTSAYRNKVWKVLIDDYFSQYVKPDASVLDLGCGYGEFINNIRAQEKFAMDLNPRAKEFLAPQVSLFQQDCSASWPLPDNKLDVVFTSNFFEHLPDKATLRRTLIEALRCLKPGGQLIALGPNIRLINGGYWDFWDHYLCLTDRSLAEGMRSNGFAIHTQIPAFLPYSMSLGRQYPLFALKLYLKMPFVWPLFGRQFLVVGQKNSPSSK